MIPENILTLNSYSPFLPIKEKSPHAMVNWMRTPPVRSNKLSNVGPSFSITSNGLAKGWGIMVVPPNLSKINGPPLRFFTKKVAKFFIFSTKIVIFSLKTSIFQKNFAFSAGFFFN
jgi:hypothetical protein